MKVKKNDFLGIPKISLADFQSVLKKLNLDFF